MGMSIKNQRFKRKNELKLTLNFFIDLYVDFMNIYMKSLFK